MMTKERRRRGEVKWRIKFVRNWRPVKIEWARMDSRKKYKNDRAGHAKMFSSWQNRCWLNQKVDLVDRFKVLYLESNNLLILFLSHFNMRDWLVFQLLLFESPFEGFLWTPVFNIIALSYYYRSQPSKLAQWSTLNLEKFVASISFWFAAWLSWPNAN